jgi:TonB-linked SusC/RagA family outer membrane protein
VQLQTVVTTALGLQREKSTLGTAQQQVGSAELNNTRALNFVDQLQGKVAGLTITGGGVSGGSTKITIRGANSINGSNQPLFVVDGVPMSSDNRGGTPRGTSVDFGSVTNDINPDNVETVSVLKGPNAAALYGSRAANGVIVITTKKGVRERPRVEVNTQYTLDRATLLLDLQNQYGQGAGGEFKFVDGKGSGTNDGYDQSYGPRMDGRPIDQFNGKGLPWVPHPDNMDQFFQTGHTTATTVAISGGTDVAAARLSFGKTLTKGVVPNNSFNSIAGVLAGDVSISSRFNTTGSVQYTRHGAQNRPMVGYSNGNPLGKFIWMGRQVDMSLLKAQQFDDQGNLFNWNYNFWNNPFWVYQYNPENDQRDRVIASVAGTYHLTDAIEATVRTGRDFYDWTIDQNYAAGSVLGNEVNPNYNGGFNAMRQSNLENNTDLLLTVKQGFGARLAVNGVLGGSRRVNEFRADTVRTNGILVPGIYNVSNSAVTPTLGQFQSRRLVNSVFGSAAVTFDDWWTVEGTARNDWSSTLPEANRSYFYPGANTSVVLTNAWPALKSSTLSYAKLRAAYARVGSDASPYALLSVFRGNSQKFGNRPQFSLDDVLANANLKPELTSSAEAGLEVQLFQERVALDASYYSKVTRNQILNLVVPSTSGYGSQAINAGRIKNAGIEASLSVIPIQHGSTGLRWTSTFNVGVNRGKVVTLAPGLTTVILGSERSANIEAREGENYGVIFGNSYLRDSVTGKVVTADGIPQIGPRKILGNINPDWTGGWNNQVSFRRFTVNALVDIRRGGRIFSNTNMMCDQSGACSNTLRGREADWDKPGIVVDGIDKATGKPNAVKVTSEQYFQGLWLMNEEYTYDASYIKLRELRVGWALPERLAGRLAARSASISLVGRNLFTHKNVPNIDPEFAYSTGNFQGIDYAQLPNNRSIGFSLQVTP